MPHRDATDPDAPGVRCAERRPRLAVVAAGSPRSRRSWSGIPYYAHRELVRRYGDVHVVETPILDFLLGEAGRWLLPLGLFLPREPLVTALLAAILEKRLDRVRPDWVISIGAPHKVTDLSKPWKVAHFEDAAFDTIVDYYPLYRRLNARARSIGRKVQRRLTERADVLAMSSEWAAEGAARSCETPVSRFTIAPMGANLDAVPRRAPARSNRGELSLLFVGYDWRRKGGPLAFETFLELRRRLGKVRLHIVGCTPAATRGREGVVHHGTLSKTRPDQSERLNHLFETASFFFMPSRQEAYGLVYCEACAFGLPPVATDTGGVGTVIKHGFNGLLLPFEAVARHYADAIEAIWSDERAYRDMQANARLAFEQRLNWRAWGESIDAAITRAERAPDVRSE
jgi:glycosyltransferase involved in cell wall biosynthesis